MYFISFTMLPRLVLIALFTLLLGLLAPSSVHGEGAGIPGRNVNVVGPPPKGSIHPEDFGLRQQNEPSCAVNPENSQQICCGFNDYRGIDIPALGDAWQGLSCSRDGGHSWNSHLLPGHRGDPQYSLGFEFAADPNLVSVPGGLIFNFIAANRDHVGGIFAQRYVWRDKEDGWPLIQVEGPQLISKGTSGRFIDKPHMTGFLNEGTTGNVALNLPGGQSRNLPAGNLGMAAAVFVGNDNNDGTKIIYWSSDDWGKRWSQGTKLTESKGVNSGVNIAANGDNVCVVWRRFDDVNESNSILYACSTDRGKRFSKPALLYDMCPFDQATLNGGSKTLVGEEIPRPDMVAFRTNAFPVIAADGKRFFAFWSDRGQAAASGFEAGCALKNAEGGFNPSYGRIVYSVTSDMGANWSSPQAVEDAPEGHQFMPAAFGANGEVTLAWIDSRDDIANHLDIDKQFIVDFWQSDQALYRHTTDIRATKLRHIGGNLSIAPSVKISNYTRGLVVSDSVLQLKQLEYNLVNARLFQQGTAPFIGDYLSVTAKAYNQLPGGQWTASNSLTETQTPTFHISWTDNRDVRGNAWGNANEGGFTEPSPYTPLQQNQVNSTTENEVTENSAPSVEDPPDNQQSYCAAATVKADRTRDQNVYSAPLYPATLLTAPGAVKITGSLQRAFPVFLRNNSQVTAYYRLVIEDQPSDFGQCTGIASFKQYPLPEGSCPLSPVDSIWIKVHGNSSAVRTIFVTSVEEQLSSVPVLAFRCASDANGRPDENQCDLVSETVLNQDLLDNGLTLEQPSYSPDSILVSEIHNPDLLNPDLLNPDLLNILIANPDLLNPDLLNPDLLNPDLLNPDLLNPDLLNPDLLNPDLLNLILLNPDLLNPDLLNPDLLNPDLLNPDLLNPDLLNLLVANPDLLNPDLLNPDLLNPDLLNPDLLNSTVSYSDLENPELQNTNPETSGKNYIDVTWQIKNSGNTTTGYMAQAFIAGPAEHDGTQLIVTRPYLRQTIRDCLPVVESDNHVLVNIINPPNVDPITNPDPTDEETEEMASFWIEPGKIANVTLRIFSDDPTKLRSSRAGLYVNSEACNTDEICDEQPFARTTRLADFEGPVMTPSSLPDIDALEALSSEGAILSFTTPSAFDAGDNVSVPVICNHPDGSFVPLGSTQNECSAEDSAGNISSASFNINVVDTTPPDISIVLPSETSFPLEATTPEGAVIHFSEWVEITDQVDSSPAFTCNQTSGTVFPIGSTLLTCTATDDAGNSASASLELWVSDTTAPLLTTPGTISMEAASPLGSTVLYTVTATDSVDEDVVALCTPISGSVFPLGLTAVSCSATDESGNTALASFSVNIVDTSAPNLTLPSNIIEEAEGPEGNIVNWDITATDTVDTTLQTSCQPTSGSLFALGNHTVNCSATDISGNTSSGSFLVTIQDTTPPLLSLPDAMNIAATSESGAVVVFSAEAIDSVDGAVPVICTPPSESTFPIGTNPVDCIATDLAGNSTEGSFSVTVGLDIVWIKPVNDPSTESLGPNLNLRWGYGTPDNLISSGSILNTSEPKGTDPIVISYLGDSCHSNTSLIVDIDAGNSSLRYSEPEWTLNWQTSQSSINGQPIGTGCYLIEIPRGNPDSVTDTKQIILRD